MDNVLHPGYEKLPDNLMEKHSYFRLLHNVQVVVGGAALLPMILIHEDIESGHAFLEAEKDFKAMAKLCYDPIRSFARQKTGVGEFTHQDTGLRCQDSCNCTIWERTGMSLRHLRRKRRAKFKLQHVRDVDSNGARINDTNEEYHYGTAEFDDDDEETSGEENEELGEVEEEDNDDNENDVRSSGSIQNFIEQGLMEVKQELLDLEVECQEYSQKKDDKARKDLMPEDIKLDHHDVEKVGDVSSLASDTNMAPDPKDDSEDNGLFVTIGKDSMTNKHRKTAPESRVKMVVRRRRVPYSKGRLPFYEPFFDDDDGDNDGTNDNQNDKVGRPSEEDYAFFKRQIQAAAARDVYFEQTIPGPLRVRKQLVKVTLVKQETGKREPPEKEPNVSLKRKLDDTTSSPLRPDSSGLVGSLMSLSPSGSKVIRGNTDFIISLKPGYLMQILNGAKTYEFRRYPLKASHMWIYESAPVSAVRYYCVISPPKVPGQLDDADLGIERNRMFQNGQNESGVTHAHKILEMWELANGGLTLEELKNEGILKGAPRKYTFLGQGAIDRLKEGMVRVPI